MASQSATNEALKQINMTLQGYSPHFSEIKTFMTDLNSSVDQIDNANFTIKFQLEVHLDVTEVKPDNLEYQTTAYHKDVIKHELEASAKILRIQNLPLDKYEVIYTLLADFFAPRTGF